jgi:hypothetical protein
VKYKTLCLGILFSIIFIYNNHTQQDDFPVLKGPYLSQKPPGELPEVFTPSILFSENPIHGQIAFYPDRKEIYWIFHPSDYGQNPPVINFIRQVDGIWTKPEILEFSREYGAGTICISPDGTKLFFNSKRPWPDSWGKQPSGNNLEAYKIWYVERVDAGWGAPKPLDQRINQNLMGVSSTLEGTLYTHGIKRIRRNNGQYAEWEQLGHPLDVGRILEGNPFISPDESYILFNKKWPGKRGYGIFISYRTGDDHWTEPITLLERLNTPRGGSQPVVTPDGKYLFYYADGKFYWVDAKIIEDLKSKELK